MTVRLQNTGHTVRCFWNSIILVINTKGFRLITETPFSILETDNPII